MRSDEPRGTRGSANLKDVDVIGEQIDYYRARAPEFDEWYDRKGYSDLGEKWNAVWLSELSTVRMALLAKLQFGTSVLDLACGTGWWSEKLATRAMSVTGVDSSPEVLDQARARVPSGMFAEADLFSWEPDRTYDLVFIGFFVSHVPRELFASFWERVGRALSPSGRVFFVDNLYRELPDLDSDTSFWRREIRPDGVATRTVNDGREFKIVKHYYEPEELTSMLADLGWTATVSATEWFFYYGSATRG